MKVDRGLARSKRPGEEFRLSWDFVNDVEATDSYSAHAITAVDVASGANVSATFLQNPVRIGSSGAVLGVQVQAGTDGKDYDVTFQLTTTQGDVFERVVRVSVRA
jgi:hypothetical protein